MNLRGRIKQALRGPDASERRDRYERAWDMGSFDRAAFNSGLITQFGAEYTNEDEQQGYMDAIEGRYLPPCA